MMKKKVTSLLLAAALAVSMSIPAFATTQGITAPGTKNTTVKTTIAVSYTVTIPESIEVEYNTVDTPFNIGVTNARLNPQGKVVVTATAAGTMTNASGSGSNLAYTIKDDAGQDFTKLEFTKTATKACKVNIAADVWGAADAGDYSGTTTFTVSYDDGKTVQQ